MRTNRQPTYADNNATTALAPEVLEAMSPYLRELFHNPSSAYSAAGIPAEAIATARGQVAHLLGASFEDEIIFTSGATESNNSAIFGVVRASARRRHIVTTQVEHPSVLEVCTELERMDCEVTRVSVEESGMVRTEELLSALRPDTLLVSIMHANNETGVIFPLDELAYAVKEHDPSILFHTDATQSAGKIPVELGGNLSCVDLLSLSGHKLHGPKGVGALFVRRGTSWRPLLYGGHQEDGRRGGTYNVPGIAGLGMAAELASREMGSMREVERLRNSLERDIQEHIQEARINGAGANRLPTTSNVSFRGIEGEALLYQLDRRGICVSTGSACTTGALEPSHVLRAMHVAESYIHGAIRFSFSRYSTAGDIEAIVCALSESVRRLRA